MEEDHQNNKKHSIEKDLHSSTKKIIIIGITILSIIVIFFTVLYFTLPTQDISKISVRKNVHLYSSKEIPDSISKRIAAAIKTSKYLKNSDGSDLFLSTEGNVYKLRLIITNTSLLSNAIFLSVYNQFEDFLNESLHLNKKIRICFSDPNLTNDYKLQKIGPKNHPEKYLKPYPINEYQTIYYNPTIPIKDVQKVEFAIIRLKSYFPHKQPLDVILLKTDSSYTIKFFVPERLWQNKETTQRLISIVIYIKDCGVKPYINLGLIDPKTSKEIQL